MKLIMSSAAVLALVVSLAHGAAVAAIGAGPTGNTITTAGGMNIRIGRQQEQQVVASEAENNNEAFSRTTQVAAGFPAVFHPGNDYQLKTAGAFSIVDSGVVFWSIAGILGLAVAVWIVSLITGVGFFKTILSGFHTFKGRADQMGFKMDSQQLNLMANQVYKAIDSFRAKNAKNQ